MKKIILVLLGFHVYVYGLWDLFQEPFIVQCPYFSCPYASTDWDWFFYKKNQCLSSASLYNQLAYMDLTEEIVWDLSGYDVIIRRQKREDIRKACAWEIASWLGLDCCIVPIFPLQVEKKLFFLQKKEVFVTHGLSIGKVAVDRYWKAFILAYILGCHNLTNASIGIDSVGRVRLFDIHSCFDYACPHLHYKCFHPGFWTELLCWPQYRVPLDRAALASLQPFIEALQCIQSNVATYLFYRGCSIDSDRLLERLAKVRSFPFIEEATLYDLYRHLFPCMGAGLDELSFLLSSAAKRNIDHGEAIWLIYKHCHRFSGKTGKQIRKWISSYGCCP